MLVAARRASSSSGRRGRAPAAVARILLLRPPSRAFCSGFRRCWLLRSPCRSPHVVRSPPTVVARFLLLRPPSRASSGRRRACPQGEARHGDTGFANSLPELVRSITKTCTISNQIGSIILHLHRLQSDRVHPPQVRLLVSIFQFIISFLAQWQIPNLFVRFQSTYQKVAAH